MANQRVVIDDVESRDRILAAAMAEFADHGLSGARVDRIAERAGANKQLIYYYFTNKDGLFDAAIKAMAARFNQVRSTIPIAPADRMAAYFKATTQDVTIVRMLQWEALSIGESDAVEEDARSAHMREVVTGLKADQKAGRIPADLDCGQLLLSFQALSAHPFAFTQMTRFITGRNASDPIFQRERSTFLRRLGTHIFGRAS
jgi:TetR/AcrR family transcriptional regulator